MHDLRNVIATYSTSAARSMWAPRLLTGFEKFCWYACMVIGAVWLAVLVWALVQ